MLDLRQLDPSTANLPKERAGVRHVRKDDPEEIARLWEIEKHDLVVKFVEGIAHDQEEMDNFLKVEPDYLVLAVEGREGHVESTEVGKLQGWVVLTKENKRRLNRLAGVGIDFGGRRVLEIAFAKHPKAIGGQIASAVRQVLGLVGKAHREAGLKLVITAYTDEENEGSRKVLLAAGFESKGKVKYHVKNKTEDHFFIWQG